MLFIIAVLCYCWETFFPHIYVNRPVYYVCNIVCVMTRSIYVRSEVLTSMYSYIEIDVVLFLFAQITRRLILQAMISDKKYNNCLLHGIIRREKEEVAFARG